LAARRGVWLVVVLILGAFLASSAGLALTWLLLGREPGVQADSSLVLRLSGDLAELDSGSVLGPLFQSRPSVRTIIETLRKAKTDRRITSLLLLPGGVPSLWAKTQEIRDAVLDFKTSRKPVVAFLEYGGDREYYLATAADKVFLLPTSVLDLKGLASYELFLRGSLDKIGTRPDLVHIGEYKTAVNTWTESGFTPAHREMAESLNRDAYDQLVDGIARARDKTDAEVRALVDQGPFLPEDALRAGLVDGLAYEDQMDEKVQSGSAGRRRVDADQYRGVSLGSLGLGRGPRLAVIYAVGTIVSGRSGQGPRGEVVGSQTLVDAIRKVRENASVRAVVLRIDSPGGSTVASDVIWRELMLTREKKPLIASMSDLAASGGYYIALPAHAIVAQPGTLTGSIGIFGGKFVTGGTYNKLGANVDGVSVGRRADMQSPTKPYDADQRAVIEAQLEAFYDQFVEKVAEARRSTPERVDAIAQGRVWTGRQARELGLVDELGGLDRAILLAKQRARLPADAEVQILVYPARRSLYEMVSDPLGEGGPVQQIAWSFLSPQERQAAGALLGPARLFRPGEPLALMPFVFVR
jgi:protease-4